MFAENVGRKGKRMGRAWGIFPWRCARRCRRKEWPRTMKWQMNWWQNSAHQTTTCHRMTQWALPLCDTVSEWCRLITPDEDILIFWIASFSLSLSFQHVYDQKNIRRRVYDALNVLMAMNIISKEKKEIKWIGLPTNSAQECQNLEVETHSEDGSFLLLLPVLKRFYFNCRWRDKGGWRGLSRNNHSFRSSYCRLDLSAGTGVIKGGLQL